MTISRLIDQLKDKLSADLAALPRSDDASRPAAVLVPLVRDDGQWKILFTKRTDRVDEHKGQVSFPGGSVDPGDQNLLDTALRETEEEIGVRPAEVQILGRLGPTHTVVSNFLIHPFVGVLPYPYPFELNAFEVDKLVTVPLEQLLDEFKAQSHLETGDLSLTFNQQGDVIWGATARILNELFRLACSNGQGQ